MGEPYYPAPAGPPPKPASADTNTLGLIGLILSIMGFMTPIVAPVGLVLSIMGMKHPQQGVAVAGLIVGIFSTLYAAAIAIVMLFYFGAIGACCMCGAFGAWQQSSQQQAARDAVAAELGKSPSAIRIENFDADGFSKDTDASGTAVYTASDGRETAVDFRCWMRKFDGQWEATEMEIASEPYEWTGPTELDEEFDD